MTEAEAQTLRRENEYLKLRNAQLQRDVTEVSALALRYEQELERRGGLNRTAGSAP